MPSPGNSYEAIFGLDHLKSLPDRQDAPYIVAVRVASGSHSRSRLGAQGTGRDQRSHPTGSGIQEPETLVGGDADYLRTNPPKSLTASWAMATRLLSRRPKFLSIVASV